MNDTRFVRRFKRLSDLFRYRECLVERDSALYDPISKGRSFDKLQNQRTRVAAFLNAVDGGDVRMVEAGKNLRLTLEPGEAIRVSRKCVRQIG